ncbi:MAG: DUF58 domain-containing protein [Deltaproteobacteria bacterium]|jgi:uncharacterized protein (DUF58 family)|nr:DUF58 domain-containing protein [Deltaproteobacteria bacterium]
MIRPTVFACVLFALSGPLSFLLLAYDEDQWPLALYYPVLVLSLIVSDFIRALPKNRVAADFKVPGSLMVGRPGEILVTIESNWPRVIQMEGILAARGPLEDQESIKFNLDHKGVLNIALTGKRRGKIALDELWLRWSGPRKLVEIRARFPLEQTVSVVQDTGHLQRDVLNFSGRQTIFGTKIQPFRGQGSEFDCLSDFNPGMDNRYIDWKHSARHRRLLAREFRQERNHQIVLGFDTGRLMQEPVRGLTKLDHFVAASLRLGWVSLQSGDLVGGCGYDLAFHSYLKPGRGPGFMARLQAFTASLDYSYRETNHTLALAELSRRLPHRSLLVLFTEFIDVISAELLVENLAITSRRHMVIFVTVQDPVLTGLKDKRPVNFNTLASSVLADSFAKDRDIVLERLTRLGVHCLAVKAGGITVALLNRYILIKQRGLL